jgi:cytochrome c biogenesis protein CcdA
MGTIVSRERSLSRAALQGGLWGLGHTASLLGVGLAVILIGAPLPASWSRWFELAVAAMLIVLGALTLIRRRVDPPARPAPGARSWSGSCTVSREAVPSRSSSWLRSAPPGSRS